MKEDCSFSTAKFWPIVSRSHSVHFSLQNLTKRERTMRKLIPISVSRYLRQTQFNPVRRTRAFYAKQNFSPRFVSLPLLTGLNRNFPRGKNEQWQKAFKYHDTGGNGARTQPERARATPVKMNRSPRRIWRTRGTRIKCAFRFGH